MSALSLLLLLQYPVHKDAAIYLYSSKSYEIKHIIRYCPSLTTVLCFMKRSRPDHFPPLCSVEAWRKLDQEVYSIAPNASCTVRNLIVISCLSPLTVRDTSLGRVSTICEN
jgi:hypothetical protein